MVTKKKKVMHPNSLKNLRAPVQKGEPPRNPLGINRKNPFTDRIREYSEELLAMTEDGEQVRQALRLPKDAVWADACIRRIVRDAIKGSVAAFKEIVDRVEGKALVRIEAQQAVGIKVVVLDRANRPPMLPAGGNGTNGEPKLEASDNGDSH